MNITTAIEEKQKEFITAENAYRSTPLGETNTRWSLAYAKVCDLEERLARAKEVEKRLREKRDQIGAENPDQVRVQFIMYRHLDELSDLRRKAESPSSIAA